MQENIIRTVLKSEVTWIIGILTFVATFVTGVIIPINTMQIQLASIQGDIVTLKSFDNRITANANDIIVLQQEIKNLQPY